MNNAFILYSGTECCLCDVAAELLATHYPEQWQLTSKVNVRPDPQLYHLYGARIPVLKRQDTGAEIGWPFDAADLQGFFA